MRRTNTQQVQRILDGNHKKTTTYYMGSSKSKDERLADIRRDKKEGDVWEEDGVEMTLYGGAYMSVKTKYFQQIKEKDTMPKVCPKCGKFMRKQYDERPWRLEGKCWDCVIEEEGKMRIAGTWNAYVEKRLRANALSQLRDNKQMLEEQLKNLNISFQVVGNSSGELETWSTDKQSIDMQRKMLEGKITQLNLLEKKLKDEEKESENHE